MYEALQAEGYRVDYERIPITDEKSPKERDFDFLVGIVIGRALLFITFLHAFWPCTLY